MKPRHSRYATSIVLRCALAVAIVTLLAGCLRADVRVIVKSDTAARVDLRAAIEPETYVEFFSLSSDGVDALLPQGACEGFASTMERLATEADRFDDGPWCGTDVVIDLPAADDHAAALDAEEGLRLERVDEGWLFEADLEPYISLIETEGEPGMLDIADVRIEVALPGVAIDGEHNADEVSGGEFSWTLDPYALPDRLIARTGPEGATSLLLPAAIGFWILVALAAAAWFFVRRQDSHADTFTA